MAQSKNRHHHQNRIEILHLLISVSKILVASHELRSNPQVGQTYVNICQKVRNFNTNPMVVFILLLMDLLAGKITFLKKKPALKTWKWSYYVIWRVNDPYGSGLHLKLDWNLILGADWRPVLICQMGQTRKNQLCWLLRWPKPKIDMTIRIVLKFRICWYLSQRFCLLHMSWPHSNPHSLANRCQ